MMTLFIAISGMIASVISAVFFYVLGIANLPAIFFSPTNRLSSQPFFPAFVGAAVFSLLCWFGIQWHFSLYSIFSFIIVLTIILCCVRIKHFKKYLLQRILYKSIFWISSYILLYWLVYIFVPLPDLNKYLPLTWSYNVDIFNYINVTQYLISSGANAHYFIPYYYQTPAVFYFYAWMSLFFHQNAMMASMPILYSASAGIGLMIICYCRYLFDCPRKIALGIAAVILSGSFYRYIIDVYFLSSLVGTIIWLALLIEILNWKFDKLYFKKYLFTLFTYQGLLLLTYSVLFTFNLIIFPIATGLVLLSSIKPFSWRVFIQQYVFFISCFALSLLILIILFPWYIQGTVYNLFEFVHRTGVLGFSLLSPAAMLGFPGFFEQIPSTYIPLTCAFVMCLAGFLYALHLSKLALKPAAYVLLYLIIGAFAVYFLYYYIEGSSRYQPWKFASYFILPLGGVFWALAFRLKPLEKPFLAVMLFFIVANYVWFPIQHQPPLSKNYEKLSLLNALPEKDVYIKTTTLPATFLALYFVREKQVHLLSSSFRYYPRVNRKDVPENVRIYVE